MPAHPPLVGTDAADANPFPVSYDVAHRDGVTHRCVHLEILDDAGRVLICRRADGRLETLGGHVDWLPESDRPEGYEEAAVRELVEELELVHNWGVAAGAAADRVRGRLVPVARFINQSIGKVGRNSEWVVAYQLRWDTAWGCPTGFRLRVEEITGAEWFDLPRLAEVAVADPAGVNSAVRHLLARRGVCVPLA